MFHLLSRDSACGRAEATVMAASTTSAPCRAPVLRLYLLACFLQVCTPTQGKTSDLRPCRRLLSFILFTKRMEARKPTETRRAVCFSVSGSTSSEHVPEVQTGQHLPGRGDPAGEPGEGVLRGAVQLRGGSGGVRGHQEDGGTSSHRRFCWVRKGSAHSALYSVCRSPSGPFTSVTSHKSFHRLSNFIQLL